MVWAPAREAAVRLRLSSKSGMPLGAQLAEVPHRPSPPPLSQLKLVCPRSGGAAMVMIAAQQRTASHRAHEAGRCMGDSIPVLSKSARRAGELQDQFYGLSRHVQTKSGNFW